MAKPIYVLGTGLSHNGSAVLLKNGQVCVGIEKERLSRLKHDGGNDTLAVQYCLDAEGITLDDVALVVQCENFILPHKDRFKGPRPFANYPGLKVVDISHHLAHAYSAVGTAPFDECHVMVIDGCGSPLEQFLLLHPEQKQMLDPVFFETVQMQCEKDSFYHFDGQRLRPLIKDFSPMAPAVQATLSLPTTQHSIGGFYASVSHYVFGNMDDVGKLMGLAPFGTAGIYNFDALEIRQGRLFVKDDWRQQFDNPSRGAEHFKAHFSEYADVARWAQQQVEKAVLACIGDRMRQFPHANLCYSGGVALNAVANAKLLASGLATHYHFEPAAADNGLALGCAYYGWLEYLGHPKVLHDRSTCFGKVYDKQAIESAIFLSDRSYKRIEIENQAQLLQYCAQQLNEGKTIGWFRSGAEFGPRALGRRSILAHPGISGMKDHINRNIKFREDFRPFAPAVLSEKVKDYFEHGHQSPYMILVDQTRKEWLEQLCNVTHQDGSARVQTIEKDWNPEFYQLVEAFEAISGIAVLLNTSLNRKGMPIVETPSEALALFGETALDVLVLGDTVLTKEG